MKLCIIRVHAYQARGEVITNPAGEISGAEMAQHCACLWEKCQHWNTGYGCTLGTGALIAPKLRNLVDEVVTVGKTLFAIYDTMPIQ